MSERDYREPIEIAIDGMTKAEHTEVLRYFAGSAEKPVAAIQRGLYATNYEIKLVENAISLKGLCLFGEKRKEKLYLKSQKEQLKEYAEVLEAILCSNPKTNWIEQIKLMERYALFSKTKIV